MAYFSMEFALGEALPIYSGGLGNVAGGLAPEVCHLNEGHAALAVLERARSFAEDHQCPFDVALVATRAGNLFTTHTAVPAGFDRFAAELVGRYLGSYVQDELWTAACDGDRWRGTMENVEEGLRRVPDGDLWALRSANRSDLVSYVRERMPCELAAAGAPPEQVARARTALDAETFTLGFARRFATYKRLTLVPNHPAARTPLEASWILWQR